MEKSAVLLWCKPGFIYTDSYYNVSPTVWGIWMKPVVQCTDYWEYHRHEIFQVYQHSQCIKNCVYYIWNDRAIQECKYKYTKDALSEIIFGKYKAKNYHKKCQANMHVISVK